MENVARQTLWPDSDVLLRVAFLYVGQGASAVVFVKDGEESFKVLLVDINLDTGAGGIDVPLLMSDLLDGAVLDVFVNTHPHKDHLCGLKELADAVHIRSVWHSGHDPGDTDDQPFYQDLLKVIKQVEDGEGDVIEVLGSKSAIEIGEAEYHILSPASYVKEDISDEDTDVRRRRIHEHSIVLKFGKDDSWIMIPGDADLVAWRDHITEYHSDRLPASVFAAPHHGSRSFFKENEEDDPYLDALEGIDPEWIIVSAPKVKESSYDHPHPDAMKLYKEQVGKKNVFHLGAKRYSYICDILTDGTVTVQSDDGKLSTAYAIGEEEKETNQSSDEKRVYYAALVEPHDHAEEPAKRWRINRQFGLEIKAEVYSKKEDGRFERRLEPNGEIVLAGKGLKYRAVPIRKLPFLKYDIYWQVVNTGAHARYIKCLRGEIFKGDKVNWESAAYTGQHWVRCFAVKEGVCIAMSEIFYVNIENPDFPRRDIA